MEFEIKKTYIPLNLNALELCPYSLPILWLPSPPSTPISPNSPDFILEQELITEIKILNKSSHTQAAKNESQLVTQITTLEQQLMSFEQHQLNIQTFACYHENGFQQLTDKTLIAISGLLQTIQLNRLKSFELHFHDFLEPAQFTDVGLTILINCLTNKRMRNLRSFKLIFFSNDSFTNEFCFSLARLLKSSHNLKELEIEMISNNQITDEGFSALFGSLFYCSHLEKLIFNFERNEQMSSKSYQNLSSILLGGQLIQLKEFKFFNSKLNDLFLKQFYQTFIYAFFPNLTNFQCNLSGNDNISHLKLLTKISQEKKKNIMLQLFTMKNAFKVFRFARTKFIIADIIYQEKNFCNQCLIQIK